MIIKQVPPAAPLDLICRTSKRRPPDNQPREPNCAAPPLDMFVNTVPGPYVPGGRVEALAFTVSLIATPLVSVVPEVELAVSQEGVLIE